MKPIFSSLALRCNPTIFAHLRLEAFCGFGTDFFWRYRVMMGLGFCRRRMPFTSNSLNLFTSEVISIAHSTRQKLERALTPRSWMAGTRRTLGRLRGLSTPFGWPWLLECGKSTCRSSMWRRVQSTWACCYTQSSLSFLCYGSLCRLAPCPTQIIPYHTIDALTFNSC